MIIYIALIDKNKISIFGYANIGYEVRINLIL